MGNLQLLTKNKTQNEDAYKLIDIFYHCPSPEKTRNDLAGYILACSDSVTKSNIKLLDMGYGTGCITVPLAKLSQTAFGIDQNPNATELTQNRKIIHKANNLQLVNGNWIDLDCIFDKDSFDIIVCWGNSLGYTSSWLITDSDINVSKSNEEIRKTIIGIHSVLKKGGKFILQIEKEDLSDSQETVREILIQNNKLMHTLQWKITNYPHGIRVNHATRTTSFVDKEIISQDIYSIDFVGVSLKAHSIVKWMYSAGFECVRVISDHSNPYCVLLVGEK